MNIQDLDEIVRFHGHLCPGLTIGVRASELALRKIGPHAKDEELIAVVETDMCGIDAIQFMTGCTFGKGNLIHLDYGKNAFTFIRRSDGKAVRLVVRPLPPSESQVEQRELAARLQNGQANPEDCERLQVLQRQRIQEILDLPLEDLFDVQSVEPRVPARARTRESIRCEECGEMAMETRIRLLNGQRLCLPCFEARERRL